MTTPFTLQQFFDVFASYNAAIWPAQIVAYVVGLAVVASLGRKWLHAPRFILLALASMWLWNGIGYHFLFFAEINPVAKVFAGVFVVQAILLAGWAFARPSLTFEVSRDARSATGLIFILFAMFIYPALGFWADHGFALAFLTPPLVMMVALATHILLGGDIPAPIAAAHIPLAIANFGLVLLVGGPLGEEFGWRGYAMSALLAQTTWRVASLLLGLVWGLWHQPLFFMGGTAQSQMPIFVFMLNISAGSVLFGWLFVRTKGSVLPAILLHTSLNTWAGLLVIVPSAATGRPYVLVTGLLVIIAAALLIIPDRAGAKDLR